jgi:hypothetical protein
VKKFYTSPEFIAAAEGAAPFFKIARDFVFAPNITLKEVTLQNVVSAL